MEEQRRSRRVRCRLACELVWRGRGARGRMRDVSAAGLSVETAIRPDEGESLRVRVEPPRGEPVVVDAIVWHTHRMRRRSTGETASVLGLVISHVPDAWFSRVGAPRPEKPRRGSAAGTGSTVATGSTAATGGTAETAGAGEPGNAGEAAPAPVAGDPAPVPFQIQVKQVDSPRTRVLRLEAGSADEAHDLAVSVVGDGWSVIDVHPE